MLDRKLSEIESSTAKFYALTEHKVESTETAENTKLCTDQVVSTSLECTPQQELHWVQEYGTSYHDVERLISNRHLWDEDEVKDWKYYISQSICIDYSVEKPFIQCVNYLHPTAWDSQTTCCCILSLELSVITLDCGRTIIR